MEAHMKKLGLAFAVGLLGTAMAAPAIRQTNDQPDTSKAQLVTALRLLNTQEYTFRHDKGRFATRDEMIAFLRESGGLSRATMDLEDPKPYELAITTTADGQHYQITLRAPSDMHDKSTWCKPAAFSDERGVIFLGVALGCEEQNH
jgi:type II secretory pathway pseudopilin PulG